jgi:hypothetical protein
MPIYSFTELRWSGESPSGTSKGSGFAVSERRASQTDVLRRPVQTGVWYLASTNFHFRSIDSRRRERRTAPDRMERESFLGSV